MYSQSQFEKAVEVYETLLKSSDRNNSLYDEMQVNLLAAKAGLAFLNKDKAGDATNVKESADLYEVAYNAASVYIARGDIKKAQEQLLLAHSKFEKKHRLTHSHTWKLEQCKDRSQGMSQEEHEEELAVISTQLAYTYQLQGRTEDALKIYKQVIDSK